MSSERDTDHAGKVLELIALWDKLEPLYLRTFPVEPAVWPRIRDREIVQSVNLYADLFAPELEDVRRARNAAVHTTISDANLGKAVEAARELWRIARTRMSELGVRGLD